jgi:hypothetical protein
VQNGPFLNENQIFRNNEILGDKTDKHLMLMLSISSVLIFELKMKAALENAINISHSKSF